MVRTTSSKAKATRASKNAIQKHRKRSVGLAAALVAGALATPHELRASMIIVYLDNTVVILGLRAIMTQPESSKS
jgi:hypothetical protein